MPSKSRPGPGNEEENTGGRLPPAAGDQQQEFTDSDRQRRHLDPTRLTVAIGESRSTLEWTPSIPVIEHLDLPEKVRSPLLEAEGKNGTVKVRSVSRKEPLTLVTVDVRLPEGEPVATLVVPLPEDRTTEFDPRSVVLVREVERGYTEVHHQQLDVKRGLLGARITDPGRYHVLGLPLTVFTRDFSGFPLATALIYRLLWRRVFDAAGPWHSLGPVNLSCCIMDLALDPGSPDRLYAGASDGGVWRLDAVSAYPTRTWAAVTDQQPNLLVQCLAVSAADPRVVYYVDRTGLLRRSPDRGATWTTPSTTDLGSARRLIADPSDANWLYVATSSGMWSSHDGGATWRANPGATTLRDGDIQDAAMDPAAPGTLFIGQANVGILRSTDAGQTWRTILPWSRATAPQSSTIRVAVGGTGTPSTRTVVARLDQEVFVNAHGGESNPLLGGAPWVSRGAIGGSGYGSWCHVVAVDPFDDDVILSGAQQLYRSVDGGQSWSLVIDYYRPHEDQHRVVFDPTQRGVVYAANDGGVFRSTDGGATWQVDDNDVVARRDLTHGLVTAQYYTAAFSGEHAVGNLYHQGIVGATSLRLGQWEGIEGHSWEFQNVYGDRTRAGVYYVLNGPLWRRTYPSGALASISTFTPTAVAVDAGGRLIAAANDGTVQRCPDPTVASPSWSVMGGGPVAGDSAVAVGVAPSTGVSAYILTGSGRVYTCTNTASAGWVAATSLPTGDAVALAVDAADDDVVFAATSGTVYRSTNGGASWSEVRGTGPAQLPATPLLTSIAAGSGGLYACGAGGVFTSPDRGAHWYGFSDGLPNAQIMELLWTDADLFAVTHGRGVWHRGRYDAFPLIRIEHAPTPEWLIELWLAIHGGDPAPELLASRVNAIPRPFRKGGR